MVNGRSLQITGQAGEYLVAAELCRLGFIATTFTGNMPGFDILAIDEKQKPLFIQVKTIKEKTWQFNLRKFLDIRFSNNRQEIYGKNKLQNPDMIWILVKLVSTGKDQFYILKLKEMQEIIYNNHKAYLKKHNGIRPRNPASMHTAVSTSHLLKYSDNWKLFKF